MIERVEVLGYRSLRYVSQLVRPFQLLVGPNGSGKSSFLDVVAFLGDILRVGPLQAIRGDSALGVPARAQDPTHLCWMRQRTTLELAVELAIPDRLADRLGNGRFGRARYELCVQTSNASDEVALSAETLWLVPSSSEVEAPPAQRSLFPDPPSDPPHIVVKERGRAPQGWRPVVRKTADSANDYFRSETSDWNNMFRLGPSRPALANLPEDESRFPVATWVKRTLMEGIQQMTLNAGTMRMSSPPGSPKRFAPDGSNLAWVVHRFREAEPEQFDRWVDHVRTALPDLLAIETIELPDTRHRYLVVRYETGVEVPSWGLSDGTLRLLALTLLAYLPDAEGIFLVEEPENGIHPRALETVYQALSGMRRAQVLCASHSPVFLRLAEPAEILCFARSADGATDIVPGSHHPRLAGWQGEVDLATLFAAGVLG